MLVSNGLAAFDTVVGSSVHALRTPMLTPAFYLLTVLANTGTVVAITSIAVLVLAIRRRFAEALLVFVVVAGGQALGTLVKRVVVRPRPPAAGALIRLPDNYSFPSGHALAAVLLYGVLAWLLFSHLRSSAARRALVAAGIILVVLIGLSRVYLGVHWPSDVLAAWILGGAWLTLCLAIFARWKRDRAPSTTRSRDSTTS